MSEAAREQDAKVGGTTWAVALVGMIAACAPHFFFTAPLLLHMQGESRAWLAIAIWAPSLLAAAGFFDAGEFTDRFEKPHLASYLAPGFIGALVIYGGVLALQYESLWTDMPRVPWDEMGVAMAVFAAGKGLETVFWQGLFQHRLLANQPVPLRALTTAAFATLIWVPFVIHTGFQIGVETYLTTAFIEALVVASVFELGATLRTVMLLHGLMAVAYVWFQQAIFL